MTQPGIKPQSPEPLSIKDTFFFQIFSQNNGISPKVSVIEILKFKLAYKHIYHNT